MTVSASRHRPTSYARHLLGERVDGHPCCDELEHRRAALIVSVCCIHLGTRGLACSLELCNGLRAGSTEGFASALKHIFVLGHLSCFTKRSEDGVKVLDSGHGCVARLCDGHLGRMSSSKLLSDSTAPAAVAVTVTAAVDVTVKVAVAVAVTTMAWDADSRRTTSVVSRAVKRSSRRVARSSSFSLLVASSASLAALRASWSLVMWSLRASRAASRAARRRSLPRLRLIGNVASRVPQRREWCEHVSSRSLGSLTDLGHRLTVAAKAANVAVTMSTLPKPWPQS